MSKPRRLNTRKLLTATAGLATVSYMGTTGCDARPADFELAQSSGETTGESSSSSTSGESTTTAAPTTGSSPTTTGSATGAPGSGGYYGSGNLMAPYCPPEVGGSAGEGGAASDDDADWYCY